VEVNYYAAFSSLFFALIMAVLIAGLQRSQWAWAAWAITAYLATVELGNYWETAQRHPSIRSAPLNWTQLRDVHQKVARGDFTAVAKEHPFPSQLFFYGFEHGVALEHAAGRRVDLQPLRELQTSPLRFVDLNQIQDPSIVTSDIPKLDENSLRAQRAELEGGRDFAARLEGQTIRGVAGDWGFIRRFTRSGGVHERIWRQGIMRLWSRRGAGVMSGDQLCLDFPSYPPECIARAYKLGGVTYAFSQSGAPIAAFRWLPSDLQLPADLRD
jgi:hypothetical protein